MIDTKELRRLLEEDGKNNIDLDEIHELLDRLEAAEKAKNNWLRANAPKKWIDDLRMERNALHARIKEMEQQEPVAHVWRCDNGHIHGSCERFLPMGTKLYALPGAKREDE